MKVAITGASGYIGPHLIRALYAHGYSGVAISRSGVADCPPGWISSKRLDVLARPPSTHIDALIHLEVKQHVSRPTPEDLKEFREVNVEGTRRWLEWCSSHQIRYFVYLSTIKAVLQSSDGPTTELAEGEANTPYGVSKRLAERDVFAWQTAGPGRAALILRPAVVYGPDSRGNLAAMVRSIVLRRFFLVGKADNVKSIVCIHNLTAAMEFLLRVLHPGVAEVFNVVDPESYSVRRLDEMIRSRLQLPGNSPTLPLRLARAAAKAGDALGVLSGHAFPLNSQRLGALLEHTHFSPGKLCRHGFVHPQQTPEALNAMIDQYRVQHTVRAS